MFTAQGAIYSVYVCADGYATGSKDGCIGLWDVDFKPIAMLSLATAATGYPGKAMKCVYVS